MINSTVVSPAAKTLKHSREMMIAVTPIRIGRFAPKRSSSLPLTGAMQAPRMHPGRSRHPATNASSPETICE